MQALIEIFGILVKLYQLDSNGRNSPSSIQGNEKEKVKSRTKTPMGTLKWICHLYY